MSESRDVIAGALDNLPDGDFFHSDLADAILAALSAAGYEVRKKMERRPMPPPIPPLNDEIEDWGHDDCEVCNEARRRAALAAAEPPGAPGDAEFGRALDQACYDTFRAGYDYARKMNPSLRVPHLICDILPGETHTARQHIRDLHRQARRAGLRELRAEIDELTKPYLDKPLVTDPSDPDLVEFNSYRAIAFRIDAMLQGADGEGEQ